MLVAMADNSLRLMVIQIPEVDGATDRSSTTLNQALAAAGPVIDQSGAPVVRNRIQRTHQAVDVISCELQRF